MKRPSSSSNAVRFLVTLPNCCGGLILAEKEFESKQVGRAHVGGPFKLISHDDEPFSNLDLLGKWNLLYFGFTNCPDICPAELDKISSVVDTLGK